MKLVANRYNKGEIIRIIREWTGLTQKEFGSRIGKSWHTIQDYELDRTNYPIQVLLDIAKEFDITIVLEKDE